MKSILMLRVTPLFCPPVQLHSHWNGSIPSNAASTDGNRQIFPQFSFVARYLWRVFIVTSALIWLLDVSECFLAQSTKISLPGEILISNGTVLESFIFSDSTLKDTLKVTPSQKFPISYATLSPLALYARCIRCRQPTEPIGLTKGACQKPVKKPCDETVLRCSVLFETSRRPFEHTQSLGSTAGSAQTLYFPNMDTLSKLSSARSRDLFFVDSFDLMCTWKMSSSCSTTSPAFT